MALNSVDRTEDLSFTYIYYVFKEKSERAYYRTEHPPVRGGNVKTFIRWDHRLQIQNLSMAFKGECCTLRYRIDITRANQKPLLHITRTNHLAHLAVFDIVINLRRA